MQISTHELLSKLVSINSIFPSEQKISMFVVSYLKKIGFDVKTVTTGKDRNNIIATYGKSSSYLAFYAHLDTVPIAKGWTQDPFTLKIKNGKAYGLGAGDVKDGLVGSIKTGEYAIANNMPIMLVFSVDEENISQGAHDLVDSKLLKNIGCMVSTESGQIVDYSKKYNVVFGRLGRSLFDITVEGMTAHAAESEKGTNAIIETTKLISAIEMLPILPDKDLGKPKLLIQSISANTFSYSIPDSCTLQYSLMSNSKLTQKDFIKQVNNLMKKLKIKGSINLHHRSTPYGDCYTLDKKLPFIKIVQKEIFDKDKVFPTYAQSVGDENIFANRLKIPVIIVGPMRDNAHKAQEWVDLKSLDHVIEVYKKMLKLYQPFCTNMIK